MRKRTTEKCLATFLTGFLVATVPSVIASGHLTNTPLETNQIAYEKNTNLPQIHDSFLHNIQELMEQGVSLEELHIELYQLTKAIETNCPLNKRISMSTGNFLGNSLFSCRGLA